MSAREIDWSRVRRVLVVRLRSIGDTVLATPSLIALKRFLPQAEIDILLEDWVAPVLDGFDAVDRVIRTGDDFRSRLKAAREVRRRRYDVVFNLHGGPTSGLFVRASGASHRVGYENYRWPNIYDHRLSSPSDFWKQEKNHSAEQQLALLGFVGVPVEDRPRSRLIVSPDAASSAEQKLGVLGGDPFVLMHPAAAFFTKQWDATKFASVAKNLSERGLRTVAVVAPGETKILHSIRSVTDVLGFDNLTLPEIIALASRAELFVGSDSGIAHMAAAVNTPSVVIFGSSNRAHWRPWTDAPNEVVFESFHCQPCPGFECREFGDAPCIRNVTAESVLAALDRVIAQKRGGPEGPPLRETK